MMHWWRWRWRYKNQTILWLLMVMVVLALDGHTSLGCVYLVSFFTDSRMVTHRCKNHHLGEYIYIYMNVLFFWQPLNPSNSEISFPFQQNPTLFVSHLSLYWGVELNKHPFGEIVYVHSLIIGSFFHFFVSSGGQNDDAFFGTLRN